MSSRAKVPHTPSDYHSPSLSLPISGLPGLAKYLPTPADAKSIENANKTLQKIDFIDDKYVSPDPNF